VDKGVGKKSEGSSIGILVEGRKSRKGQLRGSEVMVFFTSSIKIPEVETEGRARGGGWCAGGKTLRDRGTVRNPGEVRHVAWYHQEGEEREDIA